MDSLFGNFDKKKKETEKQNESNLSKDMILQHIELDIEADKNTMEYLMEQTYKIHNTYSKAATELGKIFNETQKKLSNHYAGVFEKWYVALGFAKKTVYRYMDRYRLIESCQNDTTKKLVEALPLSLSYEIAKENVNQELKEMVLNGEIKTLKEFKEYLNIYIKPKTIDYGKIDTGIFLKKIGLLAATYDQIKNKENNMTDELRYKVYKEVEKFEKIISNLIGEE